jgi:hypothetical protein
VHLDSSITNPTSFALPLRARELQTKLKQELNQKNLHMHGPTGTIVGGAHIVPPAFGAYLFLFSALLGGVLQMNFHFYFRNLER